MRIRRFQAAGQWAFSLRLSYPCYLFKIWPQYTPDGYIVVFHYLALTVNRDITTKVILYPIIYTKSLINLPFLNQPGLHWGVVEVNEALLNHQ